MRRDGAPPFAPYQYRVQPGSGGRVNWLSAFAGLAVGLVLASLAWVQILPAAGTAAGGTTELVPLSPGEQEQGGGPGGPKVSRRVVGGSGGGSVGSAGAGGTQGVGGTGGGAGAGTEGGVLGPGGNVIEAPPGAVTSCCIKLGATYVAKGSGIGGDFLGEVKDAMEAVRKRVNREGGVGGRQLQIVYKEDGWSASRGREFIENLINPKGEGVFALAVSPSSEGLNEAANTNLFATYGSPVIGADGLNNSQFIEKASGKASPWIWPVAAATTTQMHVILKNACDRSKGASCANLRPAIVFGNTYKFGVEGAYAFNSAYCKARGGQVQSDGHCSNRQYEIPGFDPSATGLTACSKRYCGVNSDQAGFTSETSLLNSACAKTDADHGGGSCNFLMLLLEPATALNWMTRSNFGKTPSSYAFGMAGAQPLFTRNFAQTCSTTCNGMMVWSGYNPPCCYTTGPVATFRDELRSENSVADENNQFSLGGYIGMTLVVEALRALDRDNPGGEPTRAALIEKLNSPGFSLDTGLTAGALSWAAGSKYANGLAHGFVIDAPQKFLGWTPMNEGYIKDPWLGQDNRLP